MSDPGRVLRDLTCPLMLTCLLALAAGAAAEPNAPGHPGLRAELRLDEHLVTPQSPIRVRFLLHNESDELAAISAPADESAAEGVMLPWSLIAGTPEAPALSLSYGRGETAVYEPRERAGADVTQLNLAPHASIGTEADIQSLFRALRYPGDYELTWTPSIEGVAPVTVRFRVEPRKEAIIVTDYGKLTFDLFYEVAPRNVESFLELAREGFYDGLTFHCVVPSVAIQGGCPKGDGTGIRPDSKLIPAEFSDYPFQLGTLAMARKPGDPDSASCQFFITLARVEDLDGKYTVIGQARDEASLRTLQQLQAVETSQACRPLAPLFIRSINLVDLDRTRSDRLELRLQGRGGAAPTTPETIPTETDE